MCIRDRYNSLRTKEAYKILKGMGVPLLIHQPSYSMLNRWIESDDLLRSLDEIGTGCIAFSPLAQGMLSDKYLNGIPKESRASQKDTELSLSFLNNNTLENIRELNKIAKQRGQNLAQMALSWVLRYQKNGTSVTTTLVGARNSGQISDCISSINNLEFSSEELEKIDKFAIDSGINIWSSSSEDVGQEKNIM